MTKDAVEVRKIVCHPFFPYFLEKHLAILFFMVFVLRLPYFFRRPLTFLILVGGEDFKWRQPVHHKLWKQQDLTLVHTIQLKPHSSGRIASSGTSDVVITPVCSEKPHLKKLMMMMMMMKMIIINCKKQRFLAVARS